MTKEFQVQNNNRKLVAGPIFFEPIYSRTNSFKPLFKIQTFGIRTIFCLKDILFFDVFNYGDIIIFMYFVYVTLLIYYLIFHIVFRLLVLWLMVGTI